MKQHIPGVQAQQEQDHQNCRDDETLDEALVGEGLWLKPDTGDLPDDWFHQLERPSLHLHRVGHIHSTQSKLMAVRILQGYCTRAQGLAAVTRAHQCG